MTLLNPFLGKGHTLITDYWYTSPYLYTLLHDLKTNAFKTVHKNRKDMPSIDKKLAIGEFGYRCTEFF
jgi:hypothetical protein